jgi:hypothetical protein
MVMMKMIMIRDISTATAITNMASSLKRCWGVFVAVLTALCATSVQAQTPLPGATAFPLPVPNVLLIYDHTTVAVINIATTPITLTGMGFMRAGGVVKLGLPSLGTTTLAPGHCVQVWTTEVNQIIGKPDECTTRDRYQKLGNKGTYFWVADYENEPFRPQLNGSALTICTASKSTVNRCTFHLPQAAEAAQPWAVLDPKTNIPMPAGMEVAYDSNQLWIGNFTQDTVLPTDTLRIFYSVNGTGTIWTPANSTWDIGAWDNRGLAANQCIVVYQDAARITPLLPCTPVAKAVVPDQFWNLKFDVMGPREERRTPCGQDQPPIGPVLCIIGG